LPYSNTFTIAGAAVTEPTLVFTQVTYIVAVSESGVSGALFSMAINGVVNNSHATILGYAGLANGTYTYAITPVAGYHLTSATNLGSLNYYGQFVVNGRTNRTDGSGSGGIINLSFSPVTYTVAITEHGLPSASNFSVTIGVITESGTSELLFPGLVNGTYNYSIVGVGLAGYHISSENNLGSLNYHGTLPVNGQANNTTGSGGGANVTVTFTAVSYTVTITETGLPSASSFRATVGGVFENGTATLSFPGLANGTHSYSITDVAGYHVTSQTNLGSLNYHGVLLVNGRTNSTNGSGRGLTATLTFTQLTYSLTFTEGGLPSGTNWTVTINGTAKSSTNSTIGFTEPNGSYPYRVTPIPGYIATWSGTATVAGLASSVPVAFVVATYALTFTESGLASSTSWTVTISGTAHNSTTSTVVFLEPNGTYAYRITPIPGYTTTLSGSSQISGSAVGVSVVFVAVTYSVTFTETGLPHLGLWGVTVGGTFENASAGASIVFELMNGTYAYSIADFAGYHQSTLAYHGSLTVAGAPVSEPTLLFSPMEYAVSFTETGLAPVTLWGITINGSHLSGSTPTLSASLPNGTWTYVLDGVPGWHTTFPYSGGSSTLGPITPSGISETVAFTSVKYLITFTETGLSAGLAWGVFVNGTTTTSNSSSLSFTLPNGTYSYSVLDVPGWHLTQGAYSGSFGVAGAAKTVVSLTFAPETYSVTFAESGLAAGTSWALTIHGIGFLSTAGSPISVALANGTYDYALADVAGYHQTTLPYAGTVTVKGGAVIEPTLVFLRATYLVTFQESGLPAGTLWGVVVNGSLIVAEAGAEVSASLPNGTFTWAISGIPGYRQTTVPYTGTGTIAGTAVTEPTLLFLAVEYAATFTETGLPGTATWSVTLAGVEESAAAGVSILFSGLFNGTYSYTIAPIGGYSTIGSGTVNVAGANVTVASVFRLVTYTVTFQESGLNGTGGWQVILNGSTGTASFGSPITFQAANGTYPYSIPAIAGYTSAPGGSVPVAGEPVGVTIPFTLVTYPVTFAETGLPAGTAWGVVVAGQTYSGTSSTIQFAVRNGTYAYTIVDVPGWHQGSVPYSGTIVIAGDPLVVPTLAFAAVTYPVSFTESGLPAGSEWGVTIGGTTSHSASTALAVRLPNGTYAYTVAPPPGWHVSGGSSGAFNVTGEAPAPISIAFTAMTYRVSFVESGLPAGTTWSVTIGTATVTGTTTTLTFTLSNGTVEYLIGNVSGWSPGLGGISGTLTVAGNPVSLPVGFSAAYAATFRESGIANGTAWSLSISTSSAPIASRAGSTATRTYYAHTSTLVLMLPNGTYTYAATGPSGFVPSIPSQSLSVAGVPSTPPTIGFVAAYATSFTESGLPAGSSWSLSVRGTTYVSNSTRIVIDLPNGTFSVAFAGPSGYAPRSATGLVSIAGAAASYTVPFAALTWTVSFTEAGLPAGMNWSVTVGGFTAGSGPGSIVFYLANGTYAWSVGPLPGYNATPYAGTVIVRGISQTVGVQISAWVCGGCSSPVGLWVIVVAAVVAIAAALTVGILLLRRRQHRPPTTGST
jgi:uncharacterized protein YcnI